MSGLRDMLGAQDDAALMALASVGLLRRARAALGKPEAIGAVEETADTAEVVVETHSVVLSAKGPDKAQCNCPATGMCRHVLMAILFLRETSDNPAKGPNARAEIAALQLDEIEAFAGADWPHALRIAALPLETAPLEDGTSCVVRLADAPGPVTFVADAGLRKALFKGPEGRRKRFVAAAALVLGGHELPQAGTAMADQVDPEVLDQAQQAVLDAIRHGLVGDPQLAQDRLFDAAVSARVDAAPRLGAQLRNASRQAQSLAVRDVSADPVTFLTLLAECQALVGALRKAPADPVLTGQLRRDYMPAAPLRLSIVGVAKWATPAGARGLRIHGWDGTQFLSSGPARAAGMDPTFAPVQAYGRPFWPGLPPSRMAGQTFFLPAPRLSSDGVLPEHTETTEIQPMDPAQLPFHDDWHRLAADLGIRRGLGLRRSANGLPALIRIADVGAARFDQIEQCHVIDVYDTAGNGLCLTLPDAACAQMLWDHQNKISGALIEASTVDQGVKYHLISVMFGTPLQVWNVALDRVPDTLKDSGFVDRLRREMRRHMGSPPFYKPVNRVADFTMTSLQAIVDALVFPIDSARRQHLVMQAKALGMDSLAKGFKTLSKEDPRAALDLAWRLVLVRTAAEDHDIG